MGTNRKYWKGPEELHATPEFLEQAGKEFPQEISVDEFLADDKLKESSTGRRDFLKFLGFSVAAATLAACEAPVVKAVPYVVKPEDVTPGMPTWYASTFYDGASYASVLVKTREGRPIHIKGNRDYGLTKGTVNPQIAASVLSLYDGQRLQEPQLDGAVNEWTKVDEFVTGELEKLAGGSKKIVLLSSTEISPSTGEIIREFKAKYGGASVPPVNQENPEADIVDEDGENAPVAEPAETGNVIHVQYDAVSYNGIREANLESFGKRIIPNYDFSQAKVIVSIAADFLNSWVFPTQFVGQYGKRRNPDGEWMSRHFQFESNMSLTGSNADVRGMIKPSEQGKALAFLHKEITGTAVAGVDTASLSAEVQEQLKVAATELKAAKGKSLVVCGSNRKSLQVITNSINNSLNNYSSVINLNNPIELYKSEDAKMNALIDDMNKDKVGAILMWNTNPAYSHPRAEEFKAGLAKVSLKVSMSRYADETATNCNVLAPDHHNLEAWNDFAPTMSHYAVAQPTIRPLHNTRSYSESLMIWAGVDNAKHKGKNSKNYYKYMRKTWEKYGFPMQTEHLTFDAYWNAMVHNSCTDAMIPGTGPASLPFSGKIKAAGSDIAKIDGSGWELALYQKVSMGNGSQAGNPWLQEMPDVLTKVTWDNYVTMSMEDAAEMGLDTALGQESPVSMVTVSNGTNSVQLPVYAMPGQAPKTIGIALGYGRGENGEKIGKAAYHQEGFYGLASTTKIGENGFKLVVDGDFDVYGVAVAKGEGSYNLACTQTHNTVMARNSIVKETTLGIYKSKSKGAYNHQHTLHMGWDHEEKPVTEYDLWSEHPVEKVGHRWGMSIDLNACFGCGSCLIACQSENNVPVVGKDEVRRSRDMHWLRLDRYFASDVEPTVGTRDPEKFSEGGYGALKKPSSNPKVVHMPMMCHHCNHAPCETVCPVAATTHSNEGLNQMAYNRCIGTRYCGNNCPYKVRRFNWFNYPSYRKFTEVNPSQDDLGRMVLNPDVVVRTRGVMEKCSFCVQKIQAGKLVAKKEDRKVVDGDVMTACAEVCPADAITFGDWNDESSKIREVSSSNRAYQALEEIGVRPNVWYQVKVRNEENPELDEIQEDHGHGGHGGHDEHTEEHVEDGHGHDEGHDDGGHH